MTGRLSEQAARSLDQHLRACEVCHRELAFLQALRLSVASAHTQAGSDHLSDEQLSALADGAMDDAQRQQAMRHVTTCSACASGLAALERALDEALDPAGAPLMAPPTNLLNRAIRLGAPGSSASEAPIEVPKRSGLFDRLFGASLTVRLSMAAGVAALVLALTVVLSQSSPEPQPTSAPSARNPDAPMVADGPDRTPRAPADGGVAPPVDQSPEPERAVAEGPPGAPAPGDSSTATPGAEAPRPTGRDWLAALDPDQRAGLAGRARPVISRPRAGLGTALAEAEREPGLSDGYVLGRALGFLERFGPQVGKSAELRGLIAETLLSLEPAIHSALPQGDQADRLAEFADGLGGQLAAGQISADAAGRRLQVFCVALREALTGQAKIRSGVQLGLLVQGWQTSANADQLGLDVPLQDAAALKRARQIIRTDQGLSDQMRRSVLSDLSQVAEARQRMRGKQRAARILEEISRLDERVRTGR